MAEAEDVARFRAAGRRLWEEEWNQLVHDRTATEEADQKLRDDEFWEEEHRRLVRDPVAAARVSIAWWNRVAEERSRRATERVARERQRIHEENVRDTNVLMERALHDRTVDRRFRQGTVLRVLQNRMDGALRALITAHQWLWTEDQTPFYDYHRERTRDDVLFYSDVRIVLAAWEDGDKILSKALPFYAAPLYGRRMLRV
jgi:hypothetical protein